MARGPRPVQEPTTRSIRNLSVKSTIVMDILKNRKAYFRSWDHQLMQEAYPFTVKAKGTYKEKWDFLKFGDAVPAPNQSLELLATNKAENTCKM